MSTLSKAMSQVRNWGRIAPLVVPLLGTVGCGPEFDPPSKLQSLRVLAVKKDNPYLSPNALSAHMTLAMEDARREEDKLHLDVDTPRPLQKLWFGGCNNPFNDNYFGCLIPVWLSFRAFTELGPGALADGTSWSIKDIPQTLASAQKVNDFLSAVFPGYSDSGGSQISGPNGETIDSQALQDQAYALKIGAGDTFDYDVPDWVLKQHPPSTDRDLPPYGLSQVFLAVCDGEIGLSPDWKQNVDPLATLTDATRGFPLTCYDPVTKKERGPDNFMVSYSNLYVYETIKNNNPVVAGFLMDDKPVDKTAVCVGDRCVGMDESFLCDAENKTTPRAKLCQPGGASDCKEFTIKPDLVKADNSEVDVVASTVGGGNAQLSEQMWIRYYADEGKIGNDAKRLQDATEGWFDEHGTTWTAPSAGLGLHHIWSVVYDNRGGVDWARVSVCVEE